MSRNLSYFVWFLGNPPPPHNVNVICVCSLIASGPILRCQRTPVSECHHDLYPVPFLREVESSLSVHILQCDVHLGAAEEHLDHNEGSLGAGDHERVVALDKSVRTMAKGAHQGLRGSD